MSYSTKGKGSKSNLPKTLGVGNKNCKVVGLSLEKDDKKDGIYVSLNLESEPLPNFEGFWIDPNDQSKGRYTGQVGKVRSNNFAFKDRIFPNREMKKEEEVMNFIIRLADAFGKETRDKLDGYEAKSLEDLAAHASVIFNNGIYLQFAIGGKEYVDKKGYDRFFLFLCQGTKGKVQFEPIGVEDSTIVHFDRNHERHFTAKKEVKKADSFEPEDFSAGMGISDDLGVD